MDKKLVIDYQEFESIEQMLPEDQQLCHAAIKAIDGSYSPYSKFSVGAAVRLDDGTIVTGANQENVAYPSGTCAERSAMFYAGANYPDRAMVCIAVASRYADGTMPNYPASPCGACRQVMAEYQKKGKRPMQVILVGAKAIRKFAKIDDVLPFIFSSLD